MTNTTALDSDDRNALHDIINAHGLDGLLQHIADDTQAAAETTGLDPQEAATVAAIAEAIRQCAATVTALTQQL